MGNYQNYFHELNIIVFDLKNTQYIEKIFKSLEYNLTFTYNCYTQTVCFINDEPFFDKVPSLTKLKWKFYFCSNQNIKK